MCPSPWAGVRLTKNYRAFRDLTDFVSDTFYDNDMVIFNTFDQIDQMFLTQILHNAGPR